MTDNSIKEVFELIDRKLFADAEKLLLKIRRNKQSSYINYLLGYIHHINLSNYSFTENEDTFKGKIEDAKRFLGYSIDSENPIEHAFWRLADIEKNKMHAIRILKKGLEYFPQSETLYEYLINKSEDSDIYLIYEEIENKKIISNTIYFQLYEFFWKKKDFNLSLVQINKITFHKNDEKQLLNLIKAFIHYELKEIKKAKSIFQKLIDEDISQKLNYSQYIGLLLCMLETKEIIKVIKIIDELPNEFNELFLYVGGKLNFNFEKYFDELIIRLLVLLKTQKEYRTMYAKIRGINAIKSCYDESVNKKTISDLKFARKNLKDKQLFDTKLVLAYLYEEQIYEAFKQDFNNIIAYSGYESELDLILGESSKKEKKIITNAYIESLKSVNLSIRNKFQDNISYIIETLHENKDYENIIKVSDLFSEDILEKADVLFEIAFAYSKVNDNKNAKKYYKKIWKKNKKSSAVANNLALLYKEEGDFIHAKELFENAINLDSNDDKTKNNLQRLIDDIEEKAKDIKKYEKKQKEAMENIRNENIYIHQKIYYLICAEDDERNIVASYSQLAGVIKASPEKVQELIKIFLKKNYIIKIKNHNIDTFSNVYHINDTVRDLVLKKIKRIKENQLLSTIGERINIDSLENLGFDKKLLSEVDLKVSDLALREILKRDLKENALALLTDSYKATLVLSGSIIEAFILNKIIASGIIKHLPNAYAKKKKQVKNMNLSEMLFTADKNKTIEVQLYHFSQALKQYRNFIHPAVEIRKSKINKNLERDAKLAWEITKKIIFEI